LASVDQQHSQGTEVQRTVIERPANLPDLSNDFKNSDLPHWKVLDVLAFSTA
jgi:hypothetical protein